MIGKYLIFNKITREIVDFGPFFIYQSLKKYGDNLCWISKGGFSSWFCDKVDF